MKKFLTVALAALMIVQSFAVFAASYEVGTDLTLDVKTQDSDYAAEATIEAGDKVDFKATVGMADVKKQFEDAVAEADAFLDGYYSENADDAEKAKQDMRNIPFSSGEFNFTLTYLVDIKLPDSVIKGKELDGFNEEAKLAFEEVKRAYNAKGATATLTITLKVKKDATIGDFEKNIDKYLGDMSFEGTGVAVSKIDAYEITGSMNGTVSAAFTYDEKIGEVKKDITFEGKEPAVAVVKVNAKTYTVAGAITGIDEEAEVTAKLVKGTTEVEVVVNAYGTFELASVDLGTYNLVVTNGSKTVTVVVDVKDDVTVDVALPGENISTTIDDTTTDASSAADVVVGQEKIAEETVVADAIEAAGADGSVEVKTSIFDVIVEVITAITEKAEEIIESFDTVEPLAAAKTEVIVKDNAGAEIDKKPVDKLDEGNAMHLAMSFPTSGKKDFAIIKSTNDGETNNVVALEEDTTNSGLPGTFYIDEENDMIHIYSADATADFAVAYTEVEDEVITETPEEDDSKPSRQPTGVGKGEPTITPSASLPFVDVAATDWFYNSVKYVYENGLFKGVTETTFEPDTAITRGMFVTVLGRKSGVLDGEVAVSDYADVATDEYYAAHVKWATENGIVNGYGDGTFGPNDIITREQMATIILRYNNFLGRGPAGEWAVELPFADVAEISEYAVEGVMYCYKDGIMTGKNDNIFDPQGMATRAEVATVLERLAK